MRRPGCTFFDKCAILYRADVNRCSFFFLFLFYFVSFCHLKCLTFFQSRKYLNWILLHCVPIVYFGNIYFILLVSTDLIRWVAFSSKFDFEGRSGIFECIKCSRESWPGNYTWITVSVYNLFDTTVNTKLRSVLYLRLLSCSYIKKLKSTINSTLLDQGHWLGWICIIYSICSKHQFEYIISTFHVVNAKLV